MRKNNRCIKKMWELDNTKKWITLAIVICFLVTLASILIIHTYLLHPTYYDDLDMFGPLSRTPFIILAEFSLPLLFMGVLLKIRRISPIILLIPLLLLIAVKYVALEISDACYITSFYDARLHFKRGFYVTVTGYSNSSIDEYFDMQPAFFWATSIIFNTVVGTPISLIDQSCIAIVKWFPIFTIATSIPILYVLYKRFLGDSRLVSLALLLQFSFDFLHFHYSAEAYGRPLYWLILIMLFSLTKKQSRTYSILVLITGINMIFLHQGLTILTLLAILALIVYPLPFKLLTGYGRLFRTEFFILLSVVSVAWFTRLNFLTTFTFKYFTVTFKKIITTLLTESQEIIPSGLARANPAWEQVVFYKAVYILLLIAIGLITSFINAHRKKDETDKLAFGILLLSTIIFGTFGVTLGFGYIERLPTITLPITIFSLLKFLSNIKLRKFDKVIKTLIALSLVILMFSGFIFYLSGRNFQSLTYAEYYSYAFICDKSPSNVAHAYPGIEMLLIYDVIGAQLKNKSIDVSFIKIEKSSLIQTYYYICADMSFITREIENLQSNMTIIYSSSDAIILFRPDT